MRPSKRIVRPASSLVVAFAVLLAAGCERSAPKEAPPAAAADLYVGPPICYDITAGGQATAVVVELQKYARLFGSAAVAKGEGPAYVLTGTVTLVEGEPAKFEDTTLEYQWIIDATLNLLDAASGATLESFVVPEYRIGKTESSEAARRAAVRSGAGKLAQFIFYDGSVLGQPDIRDLLAGLLIETEGDYLYNDVVAKVAEAGVRAVPYLIWKMWVDDRRVLLKGDLPGLDPKDAGRVRVCDVANHALEKILGRVTNLPAGADRREVERHAAGWQRLWQDRCGAYLQGEELRTLLKDRAANARPAAAKK